ncbi:hypothetical protein ACI65C_012696 [Semiaphis heraclei]
MIRVGEVSVDGSLAASGSSYRSLGKLTAATALLSATASSPRGTDKISIFPLSVGGRGDGASIRCAAFGSRVRGTFRSGPVDRRHRVVCCTTTAVREHARAVNTRGIPRITPSSAAAATSSQSFQYLYARPSCGGRRSGGRWSVFKNKDRRLVDSRLLHHRWRRVPASATRAARRSRQVVVMTRLRFTNNNKIVK